MTTVILGWADPVTMFRIFSVAPKPDSIQHLHKVFSGVELKLILTLYALWWQHLLLTEQLPLLPRPSAVRDMRSDAPVKAGSVFSRPTTVWPSEHSPVTVICIPHCPDDTMMIFKQPESLSQQLEPLSSEQTLADDTQVSLCKDNMWHSFTTHVSFEVFIWLCFPLRTSCKLSTYPQNWLVFPLFFLVFIIVFFLIVLSQGTSNLLLQSV